MQLLSPTDITIEKKQHREETKQIVRQLAVEEIRLTKRVNDLRDELVRIETAIKKTPTQNFGEYQAQYETLRAEVAILEKSRNELLRPISELRREAEKMKVKAQEHLKVIGKWKQNLIEREEKIIADEKKFIDNKNELTKKVEKIEAKEIELKHKQKSIELSGNRLAEEWVKLQQATHNADLKIIEREKAVLAGHEANRIIRKAFDEREEKLRQKDRQVRDKYASLQRASEELIGNKQ